MTHTLAIFRLALLALTIASSQLFASNAFAQYSTGHTHQHGPHCRHCQDKSNGRSCVCNPNFWIVSSRRCKQGGLFRNRRPVCRLEQFQYVNGRTYRRSPADFHRWGVPGAPYVVVIHGIFTRFNSLLSDSRAMCRWLHAASPGRPLNVIMYSWPSDKIPTGVLSADVAIHGRYAAFNAFYLSQFLKQIPDGSRVCLLGHSLGTRTVASLLHLQAGGIVQGFRLRPTLYNAHRYRAVFLAAAIDHHWLNPNERYSRALCRVEALVNVHNKRDLPLLIYPLRKPLGSRALGQTAFLPRDLRQIGRQAGKIREVDVSRLVGRHHKWQHYFDKPQLARSIHRYLDFSDEITVGYTPIRSPVQRTSATRNAVYGIRRLAK